jgi:hypothetical protein
MDVEPRKDWMMPLQAQATDPTKVGKTFTFEARETP